MQFFDVHFIYFGCVFVLDLSFVASLRIVVMCALFSLLLPCGALEKFCCHCFVVSFEVLRTCSFYIVSLCIETMLVVLIHRLSSLA